MAGILVTAVVAVAFGTGFTATRALAGNDGVWMRKGDTIVHINGPSARYDAVVADHPVRLASSAKDPLVVVQTPDGKVYTANPLTGRVYRIDLGTMGPDQGTAGSAVLVSGGKAFVVDPKAGTITPADPQTGAPGKSIRVPGPIASQAIGPDGIAYVGQKDGSVTTVRGGKVHTARVAPPGATLDVSAVGDQPVAVDVANGQVHPLNGSGGSSRTIPLPAGVGGALQMAASQPGGPLLLVSGDTLVSVDLSTGQSTTAHLPAGDSFGAPVVNGGRVYVPDDTAGQVLVRAVGDLAPVTQLSVPPGAPGVDTIEVVAQDHRVWIDNPSSQDATVVDANGTTHTIDKGSGNDVVNPNASTTSPSPAAPTPPPTQVGGGPTPASAPVPSGGLGPAPSGPPGLPSPASSPSGGLGGAGPSGPSPALVPPVPTPVPSPLPTPTPSPTPTPIPTARGTVPNVNGMDPATACSTLHSNTPPLVCTPGDRGQAPAGIKAGVVFNQSPTAGSPVSSGGPVTTPFYSSVLMPAPQSGETPLAYCQRVDTLGLNCTPTNQGPGPAGAAANVARPNPAAGTPVRAGAAVQADFYSSAPPPKVMVPSCPIGTAVGACPPTAGINWSYAPLSTGQAIPANTVWQQPTPAGTLVDYGSTATVNYDPYAAVPLYEFYEPKAQIYYLSTNPSAPSGFVSKGSAAAAYRPSGGVCGTAGSKAKTEGLYSYQYGAGQPNSGGETHHFFTPSSTWASGHPGWSPVGAPIACVFANSVPGTTAVYDHFINPGTVPGNHSWELVQGNGATLVWYQPLRSG